MAIEYLGLSEINGPLVVLEGVKNGAFRRRTKISSHGTALADPNPTSCQPPIPSFHSTGHRTAYH